MKVIPLTLGYTTIVDDRDYDWLRQYKWQIYLDKHTAYARATANYLNGIRMHSLIMQPGEGLEVHHKDGNGLHNWRDNLEVVSRRIHVSRTRFHKEGKSSKYYGVTKKRNFWQAQIYIKPKKIYIGLFRTEEEAALAYNEASLRLLGPGYSLNIIE